MKKMRDLSEISHCSEIQEHKDGSLITQLCLRGEAEILTGDNGALSVQFLSDGCMGESPVPLSEVEYSPRSGFHRK